MQLLSIRRLGWAAALVGLGVLGSPGAGAAPEPDAVEQAALRPGELAEFDLVPPELVWPLDELTADSFVPAPASATSQGRTLVLDWDGDGRVEATLRRSKSAVVRALRDGRSLSVVVAYRAERWRVAPAALLRGSVGSATVELLDANLDGRFDGTEDRLRWAGGGFHRPAPQRRLPTSRGLGRWSLAEEGGVWRFTLTPEPLPEGSSAAAIQALLAVNAYRNGLGLAPLTLDLGWCAGCQKHAEYIRLQPVEGFGHDELVGRPGYSEAGRTAAQEGVMERTGDPAVAVERLTAMMMHRTPFLCDPMVGLGAGSVGIRDSAGRSPVLGVEGFTVLRAGQALASKAAPVVAPAAGQRGVPLALREELPAPDRVKTLYGQPRGYPVSVSFLTSDQRAPRLALRIAATGEVVPSVVFTPAEPIHASFAHNYASAFLVAEAPLRADTTYEVECSLGAGAPRALTWRFTTAER